MDQQSYSSGSLPKRILLCLALAALIVGLAPIQELHSAQEFQKFAQPNIVLVYSDDVDCESLFGQFPEQDSAKIQFENLKEMATQGIRFSNFHVTTPVCGPSRACLYSGQYAHRNQCRVNDPTSIRSLGFTGGYSTFDPENELATWMKQAGYTTSHVGKYLHRGFNPDYENGITWKDIIPTGWDTFDLSLGSRYVNFPSYHKDQDKFIQDSGMEYRTDWDVRHSIDVIQKYARGERSKPLMLCWSPVAAHIPAAGAPMNADRHAKMYSDANIPEFNKRLNAVSKNQIDEMKLAEAPDLQRQAYETEVYRDRLRAIKALDEGIGALRFELKKQGMLKNTIFIFTSDHGFRFSQHRHYGKRLPYDRITKVPFFVTGPGVPKDRKCDTLLANIDIAPTLVEIAGGQRPDSCDGKSFAQLILNPDADVNLGRYGILIENWGQAVSHNSVLPATYSSLRTHHHIYTEWATGGREFFDLDTDPQQMVNRYRELNSDQQQQLSAAMRRLRTRDFKPQLGQVRYGRHKDSTRVCGSLEPVKFSGFVESDAGTKSVDLEIRCLESGRFWSNEGWSRARRRLPATLHQQDGLVSSWTYFLDTHEYAKLAASNLSPRNVGLSVVAHDLQGRRAFSKNAIEFSMAFADPETTIDTIHYDRSEKKLLTVTGEAKDMKGVVAVRVGLRNERTKEYWNGNQWSKTFAPLNAEFSEDQKANGNTSSGKWTLKVAFPKVSRFMIIARTYNQSKNHDRTPALKSVLMANLPLP
jgi:arylsulfatase A-like enzyme